MNLRTLLIITLFSLIAGGIYYAFDKQWIIIRSPAPLYEKSSGKADKKKITLYFWLHEKWQMEKVELTWPYDKAQAIKYLIDNWLNLLDEERVMEKKVTLQTALLSPSETSLYLSFDRNPFAKE
jgi:hypothetical protein